MTNSAPRKPLTSLLKKIIDNRGKTVPTADNGIPLIATNCIKEDSLYPTFEDIRFVTEETYRTWFRAHLEPGDILFVNKGTPGRVCVVPDPVSFCAAQDMIGLRADPKEIYSRYLFAFLRSDWVKQTIRNFHVGLVIPHFKKRDLDAITVPIRREDEQKTIGDLYFLLSEKIELNRRINEELTAMARLLYDYWFVQFDFPMSAAQAGSVGAAYLEGQPYCFSGGAMVYNAKLGRDIPEGWEVSTLSQFANITMGQSPPGSSYNRDGVGSVFFQGSTDFGWRFPRVREYTTAPSRYARKGDVLLSVRAPVGTLNVADRDCCIGRGLAAVNAKDGHDSFLFQVMLYFKMIFDRRNTAGTTFGAITKDDLHALTFSRPPKGSPLLDEFENKAGPLGEMILLNHQQNQALAELRDWLLPMLMNGQVAVG